jgi:hypothetical protein
LEQNQKPVHILDSPVETERMEVLLEPADSEERLVLKYSTWTDGLGWCVQKTISVKSDQIDDLHRALTAVRLRKIRRQADAGQSPQPAKLIQFPRKR